MLGIVDEHHVESQQVAHEVGVQDGPVFAVALGIEEALLSEEGALISPHLAVEGIVETHLYPVQQQVGAHQFGAVLYLFLQLGIEFVLHLLGDGGIGIIGPVGHDVAVLIGGGVVVEEIDHILVDGDIGRHGHEPRDDGAHLREIHLQLRQLVDIGFHDLLPWEAHVTDGEVLQATAVEEEEQLSIDAGVTATIGGIVDTHQQVEFLLIIECKAHHIA